MARKKYGFNEKRINRFLREKRGSGTGKHYKPWLTVSDVPSLGRVHRVYCPKTGREHHLLSDNEYYTFLLKWWDDDVIDIREQFPLVDRRETLEIAARCGVRHPVDPTSGALWVMTTDFLLTIRTAGGFRAVAYAVKQAKELQNKRTLDKLWIEWEYWRRRKVKLNILTDRQVKNTFTRNLAWILDSENFHSQMPKETNTDAFVKCMLAEEQRKHPDIPIRLACGSVDQRLNCKAGTALAALRRLLGTKRVSVDLHARSIHDLPIKAFSFPGGGK